MSFHVVIEGACALEAKGSRVSLSTGDLALVPGGTGHLLMGEGRAAAANLGDVEYRRLSDLYGVLRHGGGGSATLLVCGAVRFEHPAAQRLVALLPPLIHVKNSLAPEAEWLQSTLRMMAAEAVATRPGGEAIVTRLADIVVIQAIRAWMASNPDARTGWLAALHDEQIGRALALIHNRPEQDWTVQGLAKAVAMSRSAFSARFTALVGESPMRYVAQWRMNLALAWLGEGSQAISEVANRLGYQSEAAFSRAFKRELGRSPGAVRRVRRGGSGR